MLGYISACAEAVKLPPEIGLPCSRTQPLTSRSGALKESFQQARQAGNSQGYLAPENIAINACASVGPSIRTVIQKDKQTTTFTDARKYHFTTFATGLLMVTTLFFLLQTTAHCKSQHAPHQNPCS